MDMCTGIPLKSAGHPLAANPCTELEGLGGRQQVEMEGGVVGRGGQVQPQPPAGEMSPRPVCSTGNGNGSGDVSILRAPREGG